MRTISPGRVNTDRRYLPDLEDIACGRASRRGPRRGPRGSGAGSQEASQAAGGIDRLPRREPRLCPRWRRSTTLRTAGTTGAVLTSNPRVSKLHPPEDSWLQLVLRSLRRSAAARPRRASFQPGGNSDARIAMRWRHALAMGCPRPSPAARLSTSPTAPHMSTCRRARAAHRVRLHPGLGRTGRGGRTCRE